MADIGLYLMNEKGFSVLKTLVDNNLTNQIAFVVSSQDKAIQKDFYNEIQELATQNDIPFSDRSSAKFNSKYSIAIGWKWILEDISYLIVLHDSLLPKYRGFNPLVSALIKGEKYIGVTALLASLDYDQGDIITSKKIKIDYPITIAIAIQKVSVLYSTIVLDIINRISNGEEIRGTAQNHKEASYSLWRDEKDYVIDWNKSAADIRRFIDAVGHPYNGALTGLNGIEIRIMAVEEKTDVLIENRDAGKVIFMEENRPVVVCGKGLLKITEAFYEKDQRSIFPLEKFRSRFYHG